MKALPYLRKPTAQRLRRGCTLVKPARYDWLLFAEGQLTRGRFGSRLRKIAALRQPDG